MPITGKFREFISDCYNLLTELKIISESLDERFIRQAIEQQSDRLRKEILLIAVVGEVKSGKSTFLNHLLESNVCETDIDICTDQLERITFGEEDREHKKGNIREVIKNNDLLRGLAIIDTPGSNAIIEEHNDIAHNIVPKIDLVFFVLHHIHIAQQSAWEFVDYVHKQWQRKIIFILSHCDQINQQHQQRYLDLIKQRSIQHGIEDPVIFATAIEDVEQPASLQGGRGFNEIRDYLKKHFNEVGVFQTKKASIMDAFSATINEITAIYNGRNASLDDLRQQIKAIDCTKDWKTVADAMLQKQYFWFVQAHYWHPLLSDKLTEITLQGEKLVERLATIEEEFGKHNVEVNTEYLKQRVNQLREKFSCEINELFHFNPLAKQLEANQHYIAKTNKKIISSSKSVFKTVSRNTNRFFKSLFTGKTLSFKNKAIIFILLGFLLMFAGVFLLDELVAFIFDLLILILWVSPVLAILVWYYYHTKLIKFNKDSETICSEINEIYQAIEQAGEQLSRLNQHKIKKMQTLYNALDKFDLKK